MNEIRRAELDTKFGSIIADFTVTQTPLGNHPEKYRKQWVGLALPIRYGFSETVANDISLSGAIVKHDLWRVGRTPERPDDWAGEHRPMMIVGSDALEALELAHKRKSAIRYFEQYENGVFAFRASEGEFVLRALEKIA